MNTIKMILMMAAAIFCLGACSATQVQQAKDATRTVNDAAKIACEAAFGEDLPQGLSLEDVCTAREDLEPFIDAILGAKRTVGAQHAGGE
jgi:hypothetical protein